MKILINLFLAVLSTFSWTISASADYTLVLKNGRRITAQSYREEGRMIKIQGLGGELGIPKDQIQTILKAGERETQGLSVPSLGAGASQTPISPTKTPPASAAESKEPGGTRDTTKTEKADEEKEYQKKLAEITQQLDDAQQQYLIATQGGATPSTLTKEGWSGWTADIGSRIRDSQKGGGGPPNTPAMPGTAPGYTPREKKISDLRTQIDRLQKERENLIQEMKSKNIPTGLP